MNYIALPARAVLRFAWVALMDKDTYRSVNLAAGTMIVLLGHRVVAAECDERRLLHSDNRRRDKTA